MNNSRYEDITSKKQFDELIGIMDWESAFIKESHFYSSSHLIEQGIAAPDSMLTLKLAFCLPANESKLIEFKFEEVTDIAISVPYDIAPTIMTYHNEIVFMLSAESSASVKCRKIRYRKLADYLAGDIAVYMQEELYQ